MNKVKNVRVPIPVHHGTVLGTGCQAAGTVPYIINNRYLGTGTHLHKIKQLFFVQQQEEVVVVAVDLTVKRRTSLVNSRRRASPNLRTTTTDSPTWAAGLKSRRPPLHGSRAAEPPTTMDGRRLLAPVSPPRPSQPSQNSPGSPSPVKRYHSTEW